MRYFIIILFFLTFLNAKYYSNKSCAECHEEIYNEYKSSVHSKSYFTDELHKKVADKVSTKKYDCAVCHMPTANNLKDLVDGKARPDKNNITQTDAISCYFCHTIAYVKKSHKYNLNIKARQAKGYKPSFFGTLKNPDETDKHSSLNSPIYTKNACSGCHSHKLNDLNTTIFNAMDKNQNSTKCIKCHMPDISGGVDKINKKARMHHKSHKFLGIRDKEFRKTGVDINITIDKNGFNIILKNKMAHPLIIQPARVKYLKIILKKDGKIIWQNYKNKPSEDKKSYFQYTFTSHGKKVIIPDKATNRQQYNIPANSTKILHYKSKLINIADTIEVYLYAKLAKDDCYRVLDLKDKSFNKELLIKKVIKHIKTNKDIKPNSNHENENLSGINFSNQGLYGINLKNANLENCNFFNTNLSGSNLTNAKVDGANFTSTNLSYANMSFVDLRKVDFIETNLEGLDLEHAIWRGNIICKKGSFGKCLF